MGGLRLFFFGLQAAVKFGQLGVYIYSTSHYSIIVLLQKSKKGDIKSIISTPFQRMHFCSKGLTNLCHLTQVASLTEIPTGYQNVASLIWCSISSFRVYRYYSLCCDSLLFKLTRLDLRCQTDGLRARTGSPVGPMRPTGPTPNIDHFYISYSQTIKDTFGVLIFAGLLGFFLLLLVQPTETSSCAGLSQN